MTSDLLRGLSRNNYCERVPSQLDSELSGHDRPYMSKTWMIAQVRDHEQQQGVRVQGLRDQRVEDVELIAKVEEILLERVVSGDKQGLFALAQFYFEQVGYDFCLKNIYLICFKSITIIFKP